MILQPSTFTADLAEAALNCVPLAQARKLAEWIGPVRPLTGSGVLRPALATEACQELGIELPPGRLRTALDLDDFMDVWDAACLAGYIVPNGSRVRTTVRLADMSQQNLLRSWLRVVSAQLGLPDEPCSGCMSVLHELSTAKGPLDLAQLAEAIGSPAPPAEEEGPCPDCGEVHDPGQAALAGYDAARAENLEHAESVVVDLVSYAAAAVGIPGSPGEPKVELTPLGRMLAESVFTGCAPPPDSDVAGLMDVLGVMPPPIATQMAEPWLAARSPAGAVEEMLGYAESADPAQRMIVMAFAMGIGPEGESAWREWADRPGVGAYARMWLSENGGEVSERPGDQAWLTVEAFSAANGAIPAEVLFGAVLGNADAAQAAETLSLISTSGHPGAAWFVESVTAATGIRLPTGRPARAIGLPAGDAYQLKITLRGVSKPPVWRRVTVPAGLTLDLLHDVIQEVMGWEDGHMHVFSAPPWNYGVPDPELGHADESKVTLTEILAQPGAAMHYTYDFGDDWEHDVVLEKVLPPGHAAGLSCLAGKGACPPEDCGGAWGYASLKEVLADPDHEEHEDLLEWLGLESAAGFDPARFRLDEVNARLSQFA